MRQIHCAFNDEIAQTIGCRVVTSRIDYCNLLWLRSTICSEFRAQWV